MFVDEPVHTAGTTAAGVLSVGKAFIDTVTVAVICLLQLVVAFVASTLKVVADVKLPVGKLMVPPVPATGLPMFTLPVLFLN